MANDIDEVDVKGTARGSSVGIVPLIMAILIAVIASVAGIGGVAYWLLRSGRLLAPGPAKVEAGAKVEHAKIKLAPLDPLLVNLADVGGHAYLRINIVLREEEPPPSSEGKTKEAKDEKAEKGKTVASESDVMVRDTALEVISHQTAEGLLSATGKDDLKKELRKAIQERLPDLKLVDVLFTEFLVQR